MWHLWNIGTIIKCDANDHLGFCYLKLFCDTHFLLIFKLLHAIHFPLCNNCKRLLRVTWILDHVLSHIIIIVDASLSCHIVVQHLVIVVKNFAHPCKQVKLNHNAKKSVVLDDMIALALWFFHSFWWLSEDNCVFLMILLLKKCITTLGRDYVITLWHH